MLRQKYDFMPREIVDLFEVWFAEDNIKPIDNEMMLYVYSKMKTVFREDGDRINSDGFLICGKCGTPKQKLIYVEAFQGSVKTTVPCFCATQKYLDDEQARARNKFLEAMERWYGDVQIIKTGTKVSFTDDNKNNIKATAKCKKFVDEWEKNADTPCGLLFYGNVGTGKSFLSECIKTALIDKRVSVLMTNIQMLSAGMGQYKERKTDVLYKIANVSLLILDDFGAEDEKLKSFMFEIIDTRCNAEKPLIITTNLSLSAFENPPSNDIQKQRIYDRILSICTPVEFSGKSQRVRKYGV